MTKNLVRKEFRALKCYVLIGLCLTGLFLLSNEVLSATIFEDYFNSYTDGNLDQQGFWVDYGYDDDFQVQGTETYEGLKAIVCLENQQCADEKSGAETPTGRLTYAIKFDQPAVDDETGIMVWLQDDNVDKFNVQLLAYFEAGSMIKGGGFNGNDFIFITPFEWTDDWLKVEIEWDYSTQKWRFNVNDIWTDWYNPYQEIGWLNIDTIQVYTTATDGNAYFDTILEEFAYFCGPENCELCFSYDTCTEADCFWYYYSPYVQISYCVEPFEFGPEECGPFFKCQFCLTQELCEAETGFCEWKDIGYGEKCYAIEPTIPPTQEEWQVPDLADCGELTGVEKWLCEIKNDLLGVFMPSQTKITALYQTIGAFKQKFPFNYAESLRDFFSDIEESLDEEKAIPIKILGQESEVSFEFWEEETTIGGVAESFKNILFDFTTFIVLLGFFAWLISLIKRFF